MTSETAAVWGSTASSQTINRNRRKNHGVDLNCLRIDSGLREGPGSTQNFVKWHKTSEQVPKRGQLWERALRGSTSRQQSRSSAPCLAQPGAGSAQHLLEPCWAGAALPGLFFLLNIKISEVPKSTAPTPTAAMSSAGASRVLGAASPALDPAELPGGKAWAPLPGPHPARSCAKPGCRGGS